MSYSFGGWDRRPPVDPDQVWKSEAKMGKKSRRRRYKCRSNYVRLIEIDPWTIYYQTHFDPNCHTLAQKAEETVPKVTQAPVEVLAETAQPEPTQVEDTPAPEQPTPIAETEQPEPTKVEDTPAPEQPTPIAQTPALEQKPEPTQVGQPTPVRVPTHPLEWFPEPNKLINRKISHWRGDITRLEIDAVVNAANTSLLGGGGIDGAIHSAAGDELYRECQTLNGTPTGTTKITRGHNLPAKFILHTVGPRSETPEKLQSCYETVLALVSKYKIRSVAICGISTGIFGYPLEAASHIACSVVRKWLEDPVNLESVDRIIFCTFLEKEERCYDQLLKQYFPIEADPEFFVEYPITVEHYESAEELTVPSSSSESSSEEEVPEVKEPEKQPQAEVKAEPTPEAQVASSSSEEDGPKIPNVIFGAAHLKEGEITVDINNPQFQSTFKEFNTQITPIGKFAQLYVKKELKDGKFTIAATDPTAELTVHWQIRGEAW